MRIKPQLSKFEVDLVIDTDSENYDHDRAEHLQISTQVGHFQYFEFEFKDLNCGNTLRVGRSDVLLRCMKC